MPRKSKQYSKCVGIKDIRGKKTKEYVRNQIFLKVRDVKETNFKYMPKP